MTPVGIESMFDCFTANYNEINGQFLGIIFSLEGCSFDPGENHIANIEYFSNKIPVLGVCLGHQCIANTFGANIIQSKEIMHGKISSISHDEKGIFKNIPNPFNAVRYHSLIIEEKTLSKDFEISARSESGTIQGIRHKSLSLEGVQFHPESIETENGKELLSNFIGL